MNQPFSCARLWQAEAAEDGRLDASSQADFIQHTQSCPRCRKEAEAFATLREQMSALAPVDRPLEHRKLRQSLLKRAEEAAARTHPHDGTAARRFALGAAFGALAAATVFWFSSRHESVEARGAPTFDVIALERTKWQVEALGSETTLRLTSGSAEFKVHKLGRAQRFLVNLPDGQIEVKGTQFLVVLRDGTTERVAVSEGTVALRLRGSPEATLHAGDAWQESKPPAHLAPPAVSSVTPPAPASSNPLAPPRGSATNPNAPITDASSKTTGHEAVFAEGVAAFRAGDYPRAERLFNDFARLDRGGPLLEDAYFLRAVARSRRGDRAGARALARAYLATFPQGFRRQEAERLVKGDAPE